MNTIDWYIEGVEFVNCNCVYSCPCQFEGLPTHGHCRGFEVLRIDKGHFGNVVLDGLNAALVYAWPGPVFEGKGEMQAIIDERADDRQREALVKILHGEETEEGTTHWWVYRAMCHVRQSARAAVQAHRLRGGYRGAHGPRADS